jgi:hypothetical protein
MPKHKDHGDNRRARHEASSQASRKGKWWLALCAVILAVAAIAAAFLATQNTLRSSSKPVVGAVDGVTVSKPSAASNALPTMPIAQAVMVTVELDFGSKLPTVAEALRDVERRYQPDDGKGRTFAILDAYGEPTADGKLHMSMHVSSEKPGAGTLVFRRTGEILWQSRIVLGTNPPASAFTGKDLLILVDNGAGKTFTVDGSGNPASILDARIKEMGIPVRDFWPDGEEREVTFLYSACGCPVKAKVRRTGERTMRTRELPVIFPDDPAAVAVIARLMGW